MIESWKELRAVRSRQCPGWQRTRIYNDNIVRGLLRKNPQLDILRLQDAGLAGAEDSAVLEWATDQNRILLTHDVSTMTHHVYQRIKAGLPMSGVVEVPQHLPVAHAI